MGIGGTIGGVVGLGNSWRSCRCTAVGIGWQVIKLS